MPDNARPARPSAGGYHGKRNSQVEFSNRLKHLQRSDPVSAPELTRRLNAAIAEARNGVQSSDKRLANLEDIDARYSQSHSHSPPEVSTPRQNARQSTFNSVDLARSSLISEDQHEDDPMSRVINALRVCRDPEPQVPFSSPARRKTEEEKRRNEYAADTRQEFAKVPNDTRRSVVYAAPQVVAIEKQSMEPMPRPKSGVSGMNIADAVKKRASRKAPPPLILTVVPKAAKPEIVDVTSPITTKPNSTLPDLEPLSPFGPNFSENAGSYLVYQPKEIRHSAMSTGSNGALSGGPESPASPIKFLSPIGDAATPSNKTQKEGQSKPPAVPEKSANRPSQLERVASKERSNAQASPNIAVLQNSETEEADEQSEHAISPIFDASAAQSSRTSFGQPSNATQAELKRMPSKPIVFSPDEFAGLGYEAAISQSPHNPTSPKKPSPQISPIPRATDTEVVNYGHDVSSDASPLASPTLMVLPKRISSLPPVQQQSLNTNRFSISRKPVNSGPIDVEDNMATQANFYRATRHDSTGFTVARDFIRDSVDSEHVRSVQCAAHRGSDSSSIHQEPVAKPQQLPKLATPGQKRGKWELIADGIALMDSDSPIAGKVHQRLPAPPTSGFREPSYAKELVASPDRSRQNSATAESPKSQHLSPALPTAQRGSATMLDIDESPAVALKRAISRGRSGTDATITSLSSKPDYRARPLIQDAPELPVSPIPLTRPRTAGSKSTQPTPMPSLPSKMPTKIKFPPRANVSELGAMRPESLKLLHEQEALLRKRYDAVLNPIDDALKKKKPNESAPTSAVTPTSKHAHTHSKSLDIASTIMAVPPAYTDPDAARRQDQIAREQAAIRMQMRNLGAAARRPSAPDPSGYHAHSPKEQKHFMYGEPMGLPGGFPIPGANTQSAFTFDDDTQGKRKKGKWKFWKAK